MDFILDIKSYTNNQDAKKHDRKNNTIKYLRQSKSQTTHLLKTCAKNHEKWCL